MARSVLGLDLAEGLHDDVQRSNNPKDQLFTNK